MTVGVLNPGVTHQGSRCPIPTRRRQVLLRSSRDRTRALTPPDLPSNRKFRTWLASRNLFQQSRLLGPFLVAGTVPLIRDGDRADHDSARPRNSLRRAKMATSTLRARGREDARWRTTKRRRDQISKPTSSTIENQILTFSEMPMIVDAMKEFRVAAARATRVRPRIGAEATIERMRRELRSYYTNEFDRVYREANGRRFCNAGLVPRLRSRIACAS